MSVSMTDASLQFLYLVNSDGCNRQTSAKRIIVPQCRIVREVAEVPQSTNPLA